MERLNYTALERVKVSRPVDRLSFLEAHVRGKAIFDLGALDETAYQSKQTTTSWLHARLCRTASNVVGIDNSRIIPDEGLRTSGNGVIIRADIFDLRDVTEQFGPPEVIVAGELIEHLPNTSEFLRSLKASAYLKGAQLLVTTPNACCWHNTLVGLAGRESMHKDHLQIYSYKTLRTLFESNGFDVESIQPYYARFPEMIEAGPWPVSLGARMFQGVTNLLETITPLLSSGWIVKTRI